jgi:hypothetical protein
MDTILHELLRYLIMKEIIFFLMLAIILCLIIVIIILSSYKLRLKEQLKHVIIVDETFGASLSRLSSEYSIEPGDIMFTGVLLVRHALEAQNISMSRGDQSFTLNVKPVGGKIDITLKSSSREKR